jgi:hypothetical protein
VAALDTARDGSARVGRPVAPPGLGHTLATSPRALPVQPAFSGCHNYPVADRLSHGAAYLPSEVCDRQDYE